MWWCCDRFLLKALQIGLNFFGHFAQRVTRPKVVRRNGQTAAKLEPRSHIGDQVTTSLSGIIEHVADKPTAIGFVSLLPIRR